MTTIVKPRSIWVLRNASLVVIVVCLVVSFLAVAQAGTLTADANPSIVTQGTASFSFVSGFGATFDLYADVDYAVYSPGSFNTSFPGEDPSVGSDYVYAYQIFNTHFQNTGFGPSPPTGSLHTYTVGVQIDEPVFNIGAIADPTDGAGQAPDSSSFSTGPGLGNTSSRWFYTTNNLDPGSPPPKSQILIYTSQLAPNVDTSTLQVQFGAATELVPSPEVPEPSALTLLAIGAALLFGTWRAAEN